MTVKDGRALYAKQHRRYSAEHLPPAETTMQRAMLRERAKRGDELAAKAIEKWEAEQNPTERTDTLT